MESRRQLFGVEIYKDLFFENGKNVHIYIAIDVSQNSLTGFTDLKKINNKLTLEGDLVNIITPLLKRLDMPIYDYSEYNFDIQGKIPIFVFNNPHINIYFIDNIYHIYIDSIIMEI